MLSFSANRSWIQEEGGVQRGATGNRDALAEVFYDRLKINLDGLWRNFCVRVFIHPRPQAQDRASLGLGTRMVFIL